MNRTRKVLSAFVGMLIVSLMASSVASASQGDEWTSAGGNRQNTRDQGSEHTLSVDNVSTLTPKWVFTTGGDVSATPAVDSDTVYFPDWAGNLYAVDKITGQQRWMVNIANITGVPGDKARATPLITDDKLIIGTLGPFGGGGRVLALNKYTGALIWSTQADSHPAAVITQSASVWDGRVYVGVSSIEEALALFVQGYPCCSFRGSMLALDLNTGAILWKTYTVPDGYSGGAIWGSSPAIDTKRSTVYIGTGNNYSVPQDVLDCVSAAGDNNNAKAACLDPNDNFDSIMALDLKTGAIRWATRAVAYDAWTGDCIPFYGTGVNCPDPAGSDYDFGQAPALFDVKLNGKPTDVVGAGQKSGQYWALNADTGQVIWETQAGPGGTNGGLQWGSAVDGQRVYTANSNSEQKPWSLLGGGSTMDGVWSGLDAVSGQILWQTAPPNGGSTSGPVTTANGVVFGCSLDPQGYMYALNAVTGAILWSFASGGSCLSGAAISGGMLYWGSGYSNLGIGTPNNKLYAFGLP